MRSAKAAVAVLFTLAVAGCANQPVGYQDLSAPPATDALLSPRSNNPARLHYTDSFDTFPPIMTEPGTYPTQAQANFAEQRSAWAKVSFPVVPKGMAYATAPQPSGQSATAIHLFACQRGSLNGLTGRIEARGSGPVVTCATDFLDANHQVVARHPINFYYYSRRWNMLDPEPTYQPPAWQANTPSPAHNWNPFGDRY